MQSITDPSQLEAIAATIRQIQKTVPESVRLIAVSKTVPVEAMRVAYDNGVRDFGESRIQEAIAKIDALSDCPDIVWHFIGHLQSNKVAKVLERFQWIHSVDSLKLAQRLNAIASPIKPKICLQIKLRPDPNKFGWSAPELLADLPALNQCHNLDIRGLMVIPPYGLSESETLSVFRETRDLAAKINQQEGSNLRIDQLSMGMSEDYLLAIQAGATMIRLGRILFGDRP
jgi:PLP dependent protein